MMETQVPKLTAVCFRILLCLLGILGNSALLLFSLPSINCRIEPYKILLINLAMSDLITNVMVDIPGILVEIYGTWFLGECYCKIFLFIASLSITSSILTTFAMSLFWFHKVIGSTPKNCSIFHQTELRWLGISVSVGWLVSIVFSAPLLHFSSLHMLKDNDENQNKPSVERVWGCQDEFPTNLHKNLYIIIYLLLANGLPIAGMLFINVRIVLFLIRNRKRITALKCPKNKGTCALNSAAPSCREQLGTPCQGSEGYNGGVVGSCGAAKGMPAITLTGTELVGTEKLHAKSEDALNMFIDTVDKRILIQHFLQSLEEKSMQKEEQNHTSASIIYNPFLVNHIQRCQRTELCNLRDSHLVLIPDKDTANEDRQMLCVPVGSYTTALTCSRDYNVLDAKGKAPTGCAYKKNSRDFLLVKALTANLSITTQIRAALSIMAVVSVFSVFWVTNLTLRIKESTTSTEHVIDTASLIAASYTTIIPYVFMYSMKKCPCG